MEVGGGVGRRVSVNSRRYMKVIPVKAGARSGSGN